MHTHSCFFVGPIHTARSGNLPKANRGDGYEHIDRERLGITSSPVRCVSRGRWRKLLVVLFCPDDLRAMRNGCSDIAMCDRGLSASGAETGLFGARMRSAEACGNSPLRHWREALAAHLLEHEGC